MKIFGAYESKIKSREYKRDFRSNIKSKTDLGWTWSGTNKQWIESMPTRLQECIYNNGDWINY